MDFKKFEDDFREISKVEIPFAPVTINYVEEIGRVTKNIVDTQEMKYPEKISENLRNFYLKPGDTFITDFDSCLCADETLDKIIELAIADLDDFKELKEDIRAIMEKGMRNEISLKESIQMRLNIAEKGGGITHDLLLQYLEIAPAPSEHFINILKKNTEHGVKNFIFSGGFVQFIELWCEKHNISQYINGIHGNKLVMQENGIYTFEKEHVMAKKTGKTDTAEMLEKEGVITGKVISTGDSKRDVSIGHIGIQLSQHRADKDVYESSENSVNHDSRLEKALQYAA